MSQHAQTAVLAGCGRSGMGWGGVGDLAAACPEGRHWLCMALHTPGASESGLWALPEEAWGGEGGGQGQAKSASPAAKADLSTSRRTFRFSSTCYPETVFRIYILNCPSAFAAGCKWRPPTQPRPRALVAPHGFPEGPGEGLPATPERSLCHVGASGGAIPAFKPAGILARVQDGAAVAGHWDPGQDPGAV